MDFVAGLKDLAASTWARVRNNPVVMGWLVGVIAAAAAKYGLDLPPEVVSGILIGGTGAGAVVARAKVDGPEARANRT